MEKAKLQKNLKERGVAFSPKETNAQLKKRIKRDIMKEETKKGNITKDQIEDWKKKHGKVFKITVKVTENDHAVGYLKAPNRNHKATALSMYNQNKILESGEFLRDNCWLGGDERLKIKDDIADSAAIQASGIVKFLDSELGEV